MKSFIVAATMLVSASAFSAVSHGYQEVLGNIKLNNACITDTEVRSINPVKVCTKLEAHTTNNGGEIGSHTDWVCVAWENKTLTAPRAFERTVCLRNAPINEGSYGQCLEYGKKADFLPATIKIRTTTTNGDATSETSSWFTFPACN